MTTTHRPGGPPDARPSRRVSDSNGLPTPDVNQGAITPRLAPGYLRRLQLASGVVVPEGYQAMNDRESLTLLIEP